MQQELDLLVLNGDLTGKGMDSYPLVEDFLTKIHSVSYYLSGNTEARTTETLQRYHHIAGRQLDEVVWQKGSEPAALMNCSNTSRRLSKCYPRRPTGKLYFETNAPHSA